jgi:putative peptidoglycan lipid II flippase
MKLAKAMMTVAGLTGLSRIAGFVRDVMTAAMLGAGPIADAFFVALKLPNFFRRISGEGAFSVAFVPLYSETLEKEGRDQADAFASNTLVVMFSGLLVFTLVALFFMPYIIYVTAPGFIGDVERFDLAVELSRVTFPYLLLVSLGALIGGALNAIDRFAPFAFVPVLFNLSLIGALLCAGYFETAGHAMSWGIVVAGFIQLAWLWVSAARAGIRIKIATPRFKDIKIKRVFKLMGPGVIGAGVVHINLFADLILASFLGTGAISYLYYADRLNQLPLGMVGIAVGTALLPMLSKALARPDGNGEANDLFNRALEFCMFLALPAGLALMVIPHTLITVLFERGAFTAADSEATALVLACYSLGLPAYIATKVFSTAHWARQDTMTPVRITIAATVTNIIIALSLIWYMGVAGIALATGLTAWMQFILHLQALKDHPAARFDERFMRVMPRIILSTAVMSAYLFISASLLQGWVHGGGAQKLLAITIIVPGGGLIYAVSAVMTGAVNLQEMKKYLVRKKATA